MELSADEPTIFLINGVHTKPKPKTNPNPKLRGSFLGIKYDQKNIVGSFFWSYFI